MLELGAGQAKTGSEYIRDADTGNFEEAVLQASLKKPVIVDFWAPWCGPCKQMMPHIEKAVANANGAVSLVKINVDKYPELAEVFRVQSVPTVYAFFQGQPVDGFMGAKSETELKAFIDKLVKLSGAAAPQQPETVDAEAIAKLMADAAGFFKEDKYTDAMAAYSTVLDADEKNMEALAGIGWCFVAQKDVESLAEFVSQMTPEQKSYPRIKGLEFLLSAAKDAPGSADDLQGKIEKSPKDFQARYDLALHKIAACDLEAAIDTLVELIRRDREWQDQKARKLLVELFDALGNAHPLTSPGRRKLSTVLFS